MNFGSLFAGIGGIDLGFERAGMVCKWQVENNPFCVAILDHHWPQVKRYGDIKSLNGGELEKVDVIAGGFPCQPVSTAGQRKGEKDERWLWPEFNRIIRILRPEYVFVENVAGLLIRGMSSVLADLARIGYDCEWESLPAIAFSAPHQRYRVFIVAYSNSNGRFNERNPPKVYERPPLIKPTSRRNSISYSNGGRCKESNLSTRSWGQKQAPTILNGCSKKPRVFKIPRKTTWAIEPDVGRMAYGIPNRVDRIKALGNAVVPQVAEYAANCILRHKLG